MDEELRLLQEQFFAAQEVKSSVRLSERNIVELVNKLKERDLLDDELLHTVNGKEYITQEHLRKEMVEEIRKYRRMSLVDLASILGVDLFYVERETQRIVATDSSTSLVQGEILTTGYWDTVAEEIEETLQETGQVSLAELAHRFNVSSDVLRSSINERMGSFIHGKLEGGQLYTPAYVSRIKAIVRGALRALISSTPTNSLLSIAVQLQGEGGVDGGLFSSVLSECVAEGVALGSMRGGGSTWAPAVFARSQRESIESFYSQNGYVAYETLKKLGVSSPKQYLQQKYSEGIPLETVFVHPSLVDQIEAVNEEAVTGGSWCDIMSHVPTLFTVADAVQLMSFCTGVKKAEERGTVVRFDETCIVSQSLVRSIFERFEKLVRETERQALLAKKTVPPPKSKEEGEREGEGSGDDEAKPVSKSQPNPRNKGAKKGVVGNAPKQVDDQEDDESIEKSGGRGGKGKKKGGRGNKCVSTGNGSTVSAKGTGKKGVGKETNVEEESVMSLKEMANRILEWYPDMEGAPSGLIDEVDGEGSLVFSLSSHIRPTLVESVAATRKAAFTLGAEDRRKRRDVIQEKLDGLWTQFTLFSKGLEVFSNDSATLATLERHLLRATGSEMVDIILKAEALEQKLIEGGDLEESARESGGREGEKEAQLQTGERMALAKSLSGPMAKLGVGLSEALEGKGLEKFCEVLGRCVEEMGVRLKKMEKRNERASLFAYKKSLLSQLEETMDPVIALPLTVSILFIQVHRSAIHIPGRALSAVLATLKGGLPSETYDFVLQYHTATVEYISRRPSDDDDDDVEESSRRQLENDLAALKACTLQKSNDEAG